MYLITRWFGVFLCDNRGIRYSILFPMVEEELYNRLSNISKGMVLTEEEEIVRESRETVIVQEPRLGGIGLYRPYDPFFSRDIIKPEGYDISPALLHRVALRIADEIATSHLESRDLQIIQMVKAYDELLEVSNLLSERIANWSILPSSSDRMKPLMDLQESVLDDIERLEEQIRIDMEESAPNISRLIGHLIGARLISRAGGLMRLATLPASTIQVLGAETALFRYKKEGGKPPKHGVIFQHPYINKASKEYRGRIARIMASKISTAAKADAFTRRIVADDLLAGMDKQIKKVSKG